MISQEKEYVKSFINELKKKAKMLDDPSKLNRIIRKFEKGLVEDIYPVENRRLDTLNESAIVVLNQNELDKKYISFGSIRKLIKSKSQIWVSKLAVYYLIADLEEKAMEITHNAMKIAANSGRKTITKKDIDFVTQYNK